jgi:hypothetical protein
MWGVNCDILSKDGASQINARAILSIGRLGKENGGGNCAYIFWASYVFWGSVCRYYLHDFHQCEFLHCRTTAVAIILFLPKWLGG